VGWAEFWVPGVRSVTVASDMCKMGLTILAMSVASVLGVGMRCRE
jgi:hypothetical protein